MQAYVDRTLNCIDCHSEFIFTAGEQLFFADKQFKNDPKRCKPCKSRRTGLAAAANGLSAAPLPSARTETRTECSACGIETTVPFKPTQGRPVLCRQCFQLKGRAAATQPVTHPATHVDPSIQLPGTSVARTPVMPAPLSVTGDVAALTLLSTMPDGATLSPDAAILAATSMTSASPHSSVATPADLATLASLKHAPIEAEPAFAAPANSTRDLIRRTPLDALKGDAPDGEVPPFLPGERGN